MNSLVAFSFFFLSTSTFFLTKFAVVTDEDIQHLDNERLQLLVLGGKDAVQEERVLNAFAILYEDVLPVRFGGDILFNLLDKSIMQARSRRSDFLTTVGDPASTTFKSTPPTSIIAAASSSSSSFTTSSSNASASSLKRRIISKIMAISRAEDEGQCVASVLFPQLDINKDGAICLEEFQEWVESVIIEDSEITSGWDRDLISVYNDIDTDADGSITIGSTS